MDNAHACCSIGVYNVCKEAEARQLEQIGGLRVSTCVLVYV